MPMDSLSVYKALRRKIIHLELAPESVLNLSDLAHEFKVSRTPIKEALLTLQAEEWILRQGSHFMVTPLSLERVREITEIRMQLEPQANVWAMQRITPEEMAELKALEAGIRNFDASTPNTEIVEYDFSIHHHIFVCAKNAQLARLLERLLRHYLRFWLAIPRSIERDDFFAEHRALFQALEAKDEAAVRESTTRHIRNSVAEIMGTR